MILQDLTLFAIPPTGGNKTEHGLSRSALSEWLCSFCKFEYFIYLKEQYFLYLLRLRIELGKVKYICIVAAILLPSLVEAIPLNKAEMPFEFFSDDPLIFRLVSQDIAQVIQFPVISLNHFDTGLERGDKVFSSLNSPLFPATTSGEGMVHSLGNKGDDGGDNKTISPPFGLSERSDEFDKQSDLLLKKRDYLLAQTGSDGNSSNLFHGVDSSL